MSGLAPPFGPMPKAPLIASNEVVAPAAAYLHITSG